MVIKYSICWGRGKMSGRVSSIRSEADDRDGFTMQLKSSAIRDGEISNRLGLRAAVSLASLMAVSTASAQEGGSSGLQLPTIDVTGDQGGYQATQQSINRLQTPLLNTPQTINVVPQQEIQERRLTTMEEALRTVPGITFSAGEGGQQGDSPIIRGFVARGDIFRDGLRVAFLQVFQHFAPRPVVACEVRRKSWITRDSRPSL